MRPPALPNPPRSASTAQEEPDTLSPFPQQALVQSPRCALKMDDFECVTPKLEHFGVSEYTMCLNEAYTVARKHVKSNSEEAKETKPVTHDHFFAAPGLITQPPEQNGKCENQAPFRQSSFQAVFRPRKILSLRPSRSRLRLLGSWRCITGRTVSLRSSMLSWEGNINLCMLSRVCLIIFRTCQFVCFLHSNLKRIYSFIGLSI